MHNHPASKHGPISGLLSILTLTALLSACTGDGGDNITLTSESQGDDPVVLEVPVAYVRRPLPEDPPDLRDPLGFESGARLFVKDRSAVDAPEFEITPQILAIVADEEGVLAEELAIDIKDLESSFDGKTLVFAARVVPEPADANLENTTWNIWLLDMLTLEPSYLISSRIKRNDNMEAGGGQDIAPHFLGDDRIVFSSTRQVATQARQLNEGRAQIFAALDEDGDGPAAVLHVYDPQQRDSEFEQISFNLSHDLDPVVLESGEIIFSRWNNTATNHISLYRISPRGLELSPVYGFDSQDSGTDGSAIEYTQPRQLDDGSLISVVKPFASETLGGALGIIDAANFASADQPTWDNPGATGGQEPLTDTEVRTDGEISSGGQFGSVYPLRDGTGRLLVTWSECRVIEQNEDGGAEIDPESGLPRQRFLPCSLDPENTEAAPPLYGAWVYDAIADTQRPVVVAEEGFMVSEIIAAEPRNFPGLAPQPDNFNADLAIENKGQLIIDSVYDLDGVDVSPMGIANHAEPGQQAYTDRPARFLRLFMPVPIPDDDVFDIPRYAFGVTRAFSFREILGYVPVEPDGSVAVKVPANRAFRFSVLDEQGRRTGASHNYWLQLGAGEVLRCSGCHNRSDNVPHGRLDSQPLSSNPGAIDLPTGGAGFPGTDTDALFATEPGKSMADTWDFHRPLGNPIAAVRDIDVTQSYVDQWAGPGITPDPAILDRAYDPNWEGVPEAYPIIVPSLDPLEPDRIVINYIDHIQPIWERSRSPMLDVDGNSFDNCLGCHNSQSNTVVPPGQLDLEAVASDIDPDQLRSYRELLSTDGEQWLDNAGNVADRQRICTDVDEDGNILTFTITLNVASSMRAGRANGSGGFFGCFEGGNCGVNPAPPLPANCTEDGGVPEPATMNTVNHNGVLDANELRLLSEWLDIGAQYFNNPFDARLQQ
ncbi:MAG: hypothetical protein ABJ308_05755 [Halieaceae bacterium]